MIYGFLKTKGQEFDILPAVLKKAFIFIFRTDFSSMAAGRYDISGEDIFLMISEYRTKSINEKPAEVHKTYVDLQFMISGEEIVGLGSKNDSNVVLDDYVAEKDRALYSHVNDEIFVPFKEGMFAVFLTSDMHRPGLHLVDGGAGAQGSDIKKAVIKIRSSLLDKDFDDDFCLS